MTSDAFVWRWHPGEIEPVLCGRLFVEGTAMKFVYRRRYRESDTALPLSPRMPVSAEVQVMPRADLLPPPLADAAPDAWGRRVVEYRMGAQTLNELEYLLHGHGDRIGAFEFTRDTEPPAGDGVVPGLEELLAAAEHLERHQPLSPALEAALAHGTSIGGARPKAVLRDERGHFVAKFSSTTDTWPIVRAEHAAIELARRCGITVPEVQQVDVKDRDVLVIRRFDRVETENGICRRQLLSALTLLDLQDADPRHASYPAFAGVLRQYGDRRDAHELFRRMVFNILIGNTDDHARNHAAFWDGATLTLTPAYDLVPYLRVGGEAFQAMHVGVRGREASITNALSACDQFDLLPDEASAIVDELINTIREQWESVFAASGIASHVIGRFAQATVLSEAVFRT